MANEPNRTLEGYGTIQGKQPETMLLIALQSGHQPQTEMVMHSASQGYAFEQREKDNDNLRSRTWEGFSTREKAANSCESSSSLNDDFNRIDVEVERAKNRSSAHLSRVHSIPNLMESTNKSLGACNKRSRRLQKLSPGVRNMNEQKRGRKMFNSVRTFVACLSLLQLVQAIGSGYGKSALTSIERRYKLSTFRVGILQSCFHLGNLVVILPVSYYGSKWDRPRAIAIGSLLMTASSLLSAMPQFVGSRYYVSIPDTTLSVNPGASANMSATLDNRRILNNTRQSSPRSAGDGASASSLPLRSSSESDFIKSRLNLKNKLCVVNVASDLKRPPESPEPETVFDVSWPPYSERSSHEVSGLSDAGNDEDDGRWNDSNLYLFIAVGSVLKGMGHSPLHPLGMSFVDDYATPRNSAVYIGVVSSLSVLGPAFGFILGSVTTATWVDWGWVDTSKVPINPQDPLWVGAWWCGYVVTSFLLLLATIPFCMFPRTIPKEQENEAGKRCCYGRFALYCCHDRTKSNADSFNRDADDAREKISDLCPCDTMLKSSRQITDGVDDAKAVEMKTYHEKPCRCHARDLTDTTSCDVSFTPSEVRAQSPNNQSVTSSMEFVVQKFPSELREKKKRDVSKIANARRPSRLKRLVLFDFTSSLKGLLTDPVFLSITFAFVCLTSFLAASVTYVSKYMETQFSLTASLANLLNGSINLPMAVVGNLLGGWLIRRFDLNVRQTMAVVVTGISMTIVCVAVLLFFSCDLGPNLSYSVGSGNGTCSLPCRCGDAYEPVCDKTTNLTYRSPCHAGCADAAPWRQPQVYSGCRCTLDHLLANTSASSLQIAPKRNASGGVLIRGPCHSPDCSKSHLPVFLAVMGTAGLTAGLASTPSSLIVLRIVPPAEKAFAIGIVFVFTRILAWIPAPVYVGYLIDSACLRWSNIAGMTHPADAPQATQSERNRCEIYDKDRLRRNFFAATGGLLVLSLLFYLLALYLDARRLKPRHRKRTLVRRSDSSPTSSDAPDRTATTTTLLRDEKNSVTSNGRKKEDDVLDTDQQRENLDADLDVCVGVDFRELQAQINDSASS